MLAKRGVVLYKGIQFCTKFGVLNQRGLLYKGRTIHEVLRWISTKNSLSYKTLPTFEVIFLAFKVRLLCRSDGRHMCMSLTFYLILA